jgi:hypothetical protein
MAGGLLNFMERVKEDFDFFQKNKIPCVIDRFTASFRPMVNQHFSDFLQRLDRRYSVETAGMTLSEWVCVNTRLRGRPFSFKGYEFQRQIVDDEHPDLSVIKPSQVGLSEVQIRKILAMLMRRTMTAIFTLPNEKMFKRMSQTRIQPLVTENPVFSPEGSEKLVRSMNLMQFGRSFLHITGATEGDATSTPADAVFNDEVDLTDPEMLSLFNSRLQNSDLKIRQKFSTPTFNGYGIDLEIQNSDMHEYMIKCSACNHYQVPEVTRDFIRIPGLPDHINKIDEIDVKVAEMCNLHDSYVMCEKCHRPLDLADFERREWVAKHPHRMSRGYIVRPFSTARLDVGYIIQQLLDYKKRDQVRRWYNTVVGLPFTDAQARLTIKEVEDVMEQEAVPDVGDAPCAIGIDVGQVCHIVVGKGASIDSMRPILFKTVPVNALQETIDDLFTKYRIIAGCIDRLPYTPTAEAVMAKSKGIIVPVEYIMGSEVKLVKDAFGNLTHAQVNRTKQLDTVVRQIRNKQLLMAGYGYQKQTIINHLRDMVREEEPEEAAVWIKLTGIDHYFHALGYLLMALRVKELEIASSDAEVRTQFGIVPVVEKMSDKKTDLYGRRVKGNQSDPRFARIV